MSSEIQNCVEVYVVGSGTFVRSGSEEGAFDGMMRIETESNQKDCPGKRDVSTFRNDPTAYIISVSWETNKLPHKSAQYCPRSGSRTFRPNKISFSQTAGGQLEWNLGLLQDDRNQTEWRRFSFSYSCEEECGGAVFIVLQ